MRRSRAITTHVRTMRRVRAPVRVRPSIRPAHTVAATTGEWIGRRRTDGPSSDEDARLMLAFKAGDEGAFRELVHRNQAQVYGVIRRFLGSAAAVEDDPLGASDPLVAASPPHRSRS